MQSQLDLTERVVRTLQRGLPRPRDPTSRPASHRFPAAIGRRHWLASDGRAGIQHVWRPTRRHTPTASSGPRGRRGQLPTLRLELLSPSVLLALFDGIPELVWFEEPHHGIQFGVNTTDGAFVLDRHEASGAGNRSGAGAGAGPRDRQRVVAVAALRRRLAGLGDPNLVPQTGSAAFAIELLNYPWRQRFQGAQSAQRESTARSSRSTRSPA